MACEPISIKIKLNENINKLGKETEVVAESLRVENFMNFAVLGLLLLKLANVCRLTVRDRENANSTFKERKVLFHKIRF